MMKFIQELMAKGYLIEPSILKEEAVGIISAVDDSILSNLILELNPPKHITKEFLVSHIPKILEKLREDPFDKFKEVLECLSGKYIKDIKEEIEEKREEILSTRKVEIIEEYDTKPKKITVEDFVTNLRDRYQFFKALLQDRGLEGLTSIGKIYGNRRSVSIIGLVTLKRHTKNKNLLLEIEDPTGKIPVVVNRNRKELFDIAEDLALDEVIAIKASGTQEILFANDLIFPDIGLREIKKAQEEEYAIFTADLHFGSDKFLEKSFLKFISWLNGEIGNEKQKELSKKIKYLFIVGDLADSVGVYPAQEKELLIKDIYEQYDKIAEIISKIRKDITIIICPGNHDAVRLIEPQPIFDPKIAPRLYGLDNTIITTNPCIINIGKTDSFEGFNVLLYHGRSVDYYMDAIDSLRLSNAKLNPETVLKFLLKKRHLAPTHASTTALPELYDFLSIRKIPDIVVTGHMHRSGIINYNGVLGISCSCWQSKTGYQEKLGHEPDPGKVCLFNLKTRKINVLDFS
ncbi:MAG: metallophosphoesterase [archaeon]|nr:MAG: metallophosphoesterase [archaeon]